MADDKILKEGDPSRAGIDIAGRPAVDPTENVKLLNAASERRQDDLRDAIVKLFDCRIDCLKEVTALRAHHGSEMIKAESRRVDEQAVIRAGYAEQLAVGEAKRIDAIRAVDVSAVAVASQRASDQAAVLAAQVAVSAEALRVLVATTATTVATSQQQLATTLSTRLTTLEQAGYQAQGKQAYSDPAFAELLNEVKGLRETSRQTAGVGQGVNASWLVFVAIGGMVLTGLGVFAFGHTSAPPQVVYSQTPTVVTPIPPAARTP